MHVHKNSPEASKDTSALITIGNPSNLFDGTMFMDLIKSQTEHTDDNGYHQTATE
jgi:hypothetical protein